MNSLCEVENLVDQHYLKTKLPVRERDEGSLIPVRDNP